MLTRELLRYRITGEEITPIYLTPTGGRKYLRFATAIVDSYRAGVGTRLSEIHARLAPLTMTPADLTVLRGLVKVAEESARIAAPAEIDAGALRRAVFLLAAEHGAGVRRDDPDFLAAAHAPLAAIAETFGITTDEVFSLLFADLKERRILRTFDETLTPAGLLARYNTALAQAMLYRATRLVVDLADSYKTVFKYIKLAGLMHTVRAHESGYRIWLDGPLSLFAQVERYGVAMARLLPAILLCHRWRLIALVRVGDTEKRFTLSPRDGLTSHYPAEAVFDSALEAAFFRRFTRRAHKGWTITREGAILDLRDTVLIPDFTFTHADGRIAHLEIVGFWTPEYLRRKISKLRRLDAANVIVAIPARRDCPLDDLTGPVIRFKTRVLLKDLLPALERAAVRPPSI
jgi:predicted nuclease of restriction endonuclease-like RecB superfamily